MNDATSCPPSGERRHQVDGAPRERRGVGRRRASHAAAEAIVSAARPDHASAPPPPPVLMDERDHALARREHQVAARESELRAGDGLRRKLEQNIATLRLANEKLVISSIETQCLNDEIRRAKDLMAHMAHHDVLTGLPNRGLLLERLTRTIAHARSHGTELAVLFLDLDRFKVINDSLGHAAGDSVLRLVAARLLATLRATDTASRQGGDEFVLLLPEMAGEAVVAELCDQLCAAVAAPYHVAGQQVHLGVTIGASLYPRDGMDAATLISNADVAMYHAKHAGRGGTRFYHPDLNLRAIARQRTESELHRAVGGHQFVLHYQPKVHLDSGRITGAEALLRWIHPQAGLIAPDRFIPVAEACGLIVPIGRWVLDEACRQAQSWRAAGLQPGSVAINISALEFRCPDFVDHVRATLARTGLAAACLELEITESVLMDDAAASATILHQLKQLGVQLAVDDFGTGYSSLSYLSQFPIDVLKIDQSFVRALDQPHGDSVIVSAVIAMGGSLGHRVIAEGIEDQRQLRFLRRHHCAEGQGYLFSRPLTAAAFAALLRHGWPPAPATRS